MTDSRLLKETIEGSGISVSFLARKLGISREGFYKKLNNESEFKASEILCLSDALHLTDDRRDSIFFAKNVECNAT